MTPLIGIPAGVKVEGSFPLHTVSEKYLTAVVDAVGGLPVIVPALGAERIDVADLARRLDGVLLTGGLSNIEPHRYGDGPSRPDTPHDRARDSTTLPLIRACIGEGVPILAICRGIQELNVALGGTLHQHVHEVAGKNDHRSDKTKPWIERYGHAHPVQLAPGGFLARALGTAEAQVNSLHGQGIDRLAPGLIVEATAPDGLIEAVRVDGAAFAIGVQWHAEYPSLADPVSKALFDGFAKACHARAEARVRAILRARAA
ncbi:MAG: gamma-glutamyl-gamma-aminobutyrate hydrolase family protein [Alphaproteobacteria bacterium]|nr:gamma-glutamyl-gamma-aminobutyrate hydrolase family protein [Alphaproteobacteria bacterium]